MTTQASVGARNLALDAWETEMGASPILKLRTGTPPATCATADSGSVIATMTLPADAMASASGGSKAKSGTWSDPAADASGTIGHYRIYKTDGTTCVVQGTVTLTGGGGDMTLDAVVVTAGQAITIATYSWTAGNA